MEVLSSARACLNKENQSSEHHKQLQRLRVQLNDRIFQLHKLNEDHAQEKAKIYIQLQKEKQLHAKTVKQLRDKIKEDNEGWVKMIDHLRKDKQESLTQLTQDLQHSIQKQAHQAIQNNEEKCSKEIRQLTHRIAQQQQAFRRREEELVREAKAEAQSLLASAHKTEQEKQRKHKAVLLELKAEYESNLTKIQQMFVKEQSLRLQVQNDYQNAIKSHVREKIIWESVESALNQKITELQEQISKKSRQILNLSDQKRQIELTCSAELQQMGLECESRLGKLNEEHEARQRDNCYRYSGQIQLLKAEMGKLVDIHRKKEQSWLQSGKMVLQLYEKRQSKRQDVKAIQHLQVQLIKKDFLIQRQRKQLKNCRLQLQNMEEIYDRIFIFNSNLSRSKTKSYQIKKLKASGQLNHSNRSTIISDKAAQRRYLIQKSE